jgi:enoyl-CoA hydratase/carnithine racemase
VRAAKKALAHTAVQSSIRSGLAAEFAAYITLLDSNDRLEGLEAFREKRQPVYTGS